MNGKSAVLLTVFTSFFAVAVQADMAGLDQSPGTTLRPIYVGKDLPQQQQLHQKPAHPIPVPDTDQGDAIVDEKKRQPSKYAGFLKAVSPEYKVNRNKLGLVYVARERPNRRALSFVFLVNRRTHQSADQADRPRRMHIMWRGSKKILVEQKKIDHEYPIDVSVANYEDGYAPGEWNFITPGSKPREVTVAFTWSF